MGSVSDDWVVGRDFGNGMQKDFGSLSMGLVQCGKEMVFLGSQCCSGHAIRPSIQLCTRTKLPSYASLLSVEQLRCTMSFQAKVTIS